MGKKYLNTPPMIHMMSIRLKTTAPPSIIADKSVAPRLSNSWCPASLRRDWRRLLTQNCSQKTAGIRARAISRLYSGVSINQPFLSYSRANVFCHISPISFSGGISPEAAGRFISASPDMKAGLIEIYLLNLPTAAARFIYQP